MSELYNRIAMLCKQQGISIGKMCNQLGISRGNLTELKMERIKTLKTDNLTKIAVFFNVSVDYLLGNEEKPAAQKGDEPIKEDPFADQLFAAYGEVKEEFSQEDIDDIKMFMEMVAKRKRMKKERDGK